MSDKRKKILNKVIIHMINRGFTDDSVNSFLDRIASLSNKEANKVVKRMKALPIVMLEGEVMNIKQTTWFRIGEFQNIMNTNEYLERYWLYTGGRGSGKSHDIGETIVLQTFEKGIGVLFARYMAKSVATSIAPSFIASAKRLGLDQHFYITQDKIINKSTGSFIYMGGLHSAGASTSGLKSLEGVNNVYIDEAEDLDSLRAWSEFNKLDDSIRSLEKINRICLVLNPKSRSGQVYKNFVEGNSKPVKFGGYDVEISNRSDVKHIHCTFHRVKEYLDSGWLFKHEVARKRAEDGVDFETGRMLTEEEHSIAIEFYSNNYIGIFNNFVAGKIFPYYETEEVFPTHLEVHYGLDFGFSHVDALVKTAVCLRTKRIYVQKLIFESGLSEGALGTRIMEETPRNCQIVCDSAEPRLINDLRRSTGRSLQGVKKMEVSYQLQQMLDFTIVICGDVSTREPVENEFNLYRWSDELDAKGKPKANKKDDVDNSIDALRYALTIAMKDYDRIGSAVSKPDKQPIVQVETSRERKQRMFVEALARKKNRKV
jgi:phage terminase large subunit